jgi:hypothetical protein
MHRLDISLGLHLHEMLKLDATSTTLLKVFFGLQPVAGQEYPIFSGL